jgi:hypothetical protein
MPQRKLWIVWLAMVTAVAPLGVAQAQEDTKQ